ncbi:hypothetical protein BYT27DRAFT_7341208 [Phlegmacium glaucopus]|nr:hypothetical protein BYT27DRAFT_7341208 [Phlegmacium glaucopus]
MNPLRRILQSLKSPPSKSWNLIIMPDPRRCIGLGRIGSTDGLYEFYMRLDGNMNMRHYLSRNPLFGFAPNTSCMKLAPHNQHILTEWIKIIAKNRQTQTNPTVQNTLVELLEAFLHYELQSEEGIGAAIREIESRLSAVASFEPHDASPSSPPQ